MKRLSLILFLIITANLIAQIDADLDNKFRLAQLFEQEGQLEKAETIFRELNAAQPWNYSFLDGLNRILVRQKKYDESILLLENRIKETPADVSLYGLLGTTYYMMDNINKAYESWERGIKTNPNTYIVYRVLANYALENRLFEKALELLNRGKAFAEDPAIFSLDLANIYSVNMRFEEAAREYCTLVSIKPDQSGIVKSRLQNYFNRPGAAESTIKVVKEFTEKNKLPVLYDLLSFCYSLSGNLKEAFETTIEYDKLSAGNGNYIFTFAQEAYRNKQFEFAAKSFKYFIEKFSQSPLIPIARIGYSKTLEDDLNSRIANSPDSWKPITISKVLYEKEYLDVIKSYEQLANSYPNNATFVEANFRIAEIYFNRLNNFSKADSIYNIVISKSTFSNFTSLSYLSKAKIAMKENRLEEALNFLRSSGHIDLSDFQTLNEAKFYFGLVNFWKGDFAQSVNTFKEILNNLNNDFANDAIEYSALISSSKKDSINLIKYANGDRLLFQNKPKESAIEFKTLADNPNLFILNEFANYKLAEIFLMTDDFFSAVQILEKLSNNEKVAIFADKSTFLLGLTYQFGLGDLTKASSNYQKLLEKFPNSLYFDKAREYLNAISNKSG
ncbi:MAG: tetratricopeptide repeat protein [Ignavibacteria bacterium]|nr:tetratricopeptide repeat protein [Ignavibacteria bacterium]